MTSYVLPLNRLPLLQVRGVSTLLQSTKDASRNFMMIKTLSTLVKIHNCCPFVYPSQRCLSQATKLPSEFQ